MPGQRAGAGVREGGQQCGVINPYALAEVVTGRRIDWAATDAPRMLEDVLQTPYDELFDPVFEGPLYTGLALDERMRLQQVRPALLDVAIELSTDDAQVAVGAETEIRVLGDLGPRFEGQEVSGIPVVSARTVEGGRLQLVLRPPERQRLERLARVFTKEVIDSITLDPSQEIPIDWTPPRGRWADSGDFFRETAEFFDPVQGAVANCYFIAAMSAVAWATPRRILRSTRATGTDQERFVDVIMFYRPDSGGLVEREVEVTEAVPVDGSGNLMYGRSSESGEMWPAIYEKAYAKFKTGDASDRPDILATAWGDCVLATSHLNGGQRSYWNTAGRSGAQVWDLVRGNSIGGRTFNPMTCWTYSSGAASEKKIMYGDANIVASHCYTILGWDYRNGVRYLIVRNPWGNTEPTVGQLTGTTVLHDISWWRPIALAPNDGTFGITADDFQRYFAGLGTAF
jgi:Calpain family cysteine protease